MISVILSGRLPALDGISVRKIKEDSYVQSSLTLMKFATARIDLMWTQELEILFYELCLVVFFFPVCLLF